VNRKELEDRITARAAAWNHHDVDTLTADHAEDGLVHSVIAGTVNGRLSIREVYSRWFLAFPDLAFRHDLVVIDGDVAIVMWTLSGTHRAMFLGLAPTGRRMRFSGVFVYVFAGGWIQTEHRFVDLAGVVVQAVGFDEL